MNRIKRLAQSYERHITVPWREDAAPAQRVIFCVYRETDERTLRAKVDEFELVTRDAGHEWACFDLTDSFPTWFSSKRYAKRYFQEPSRLSTPLPKYLEHIESAFDSFLDDHQVDENTVVAMQGVGSLFGFLKVKEVIDKLAPKVAGRLLVFFPGSFEDNNYRLLDGYDGWNYLAVPITANNQA